MNVHKNEGCNASKEMSSANEGEGRRSPSIEIEKQWSESPHKRLLMQTLYMKGAKILPCPVP